MTLVIAMLIFRSIVSAFIVARSIRLVGKGYRSMTLVFFLFAFISIIVNNMYWLTYEMLRPDTRMPFAANEIGEAGVHMLLSSALAFAVPKDAVSHKKELAGAILFSAGCVALWIGSSGEVFQDILSGAVFFWFMYVTVRSARQTSAFSKPQWIIIIVLGAVLLLSQASIFFMGDQVLKDRQDLFCYLLMTVCSVILMIRSYFALLKKEETKKCLALSYFACLWVISSLYMSEGVWYAVFLFLLSLEFIKMHLAIEREVTGN